MGHSFNDREKQRTTERLGWEGECGGERELI